MDKRIIHMEGEGRYRMAITKYGRLGALRVECSNSMVSLITNHSFFFDFFFDMLFAGGSTDYEPTIGGAFVFYARDNSLWAFWNSGSVCMKMSSSNFSIKPSKLI